MSKKTVPESQAGPEPNESFDQILSQYEQSHSKKADERGKAIEGTVITVTADSVVLDIGFKTEGILPLAGFREGEAPQLGDKIPVTIKGRDADGYYQLTRGRIQRVTDWASLEQAFNERATIVGTVSGVVKGGLSVDVGVRAFMPASRSGVRAAAELEKLVGQEIRCRIIKLDVADEDVVVDRRAVAEDEERAAGERRYSELKEGETVSGTVRSLTDYGAFVDIGGIDGLLHVGEISWRRIAKPADVLAAGQQIEARVLKVDLEKRRISLSMRQLQPHPWEGAAETYKVGERVQGVVTRLTDFGAFVEVEPGVEGLIHVSEMSWAKKVRTPSDVLKSGETVEAVILGVNAGERRMSLGLKQTLGDPWADAAQKFPVGTIISGPVTSLTKFGAFVQLAEGVEGMIHVSDISAEKRINHPQDVFRAGQVVQAQVLELDTAKRRLKLGIKQMVPSSLDEYMAEHHEGDKVSGRITEVSNGLATVELGQGVRGTCAMPAGQRAEAASAAPKADLSSLTSMLSARWKGGSAAAAGREDARSGQIRSFRIVHLDPSAKTIELELAE